MSGLVINRLILVVRLWHLESKSVELKQLMGIVFAIMIFAAPYLRVLLLIDPPIVGLKLYSIKWRHYWQNYLIIKNMNHPFYFLKLPLILLLV
mgnify:CR=1 FL=1|jgi:hypothetical protein